jgi:hypothetical protein
MLSSNSKMDDLKDKLSDLRETVAVLENRVESIDRQLESRNRWLQGILIIVVAALLLGALKNATDASTSPKSNPTSVSANTNKVK